MATVGHTLVGLSFGGLCSRAARRQAMPFVWLGLLILVSHLIDVVEWATVIFNPAIADTHYLTHSPGLVLLLTILLLLAVFAVTRMRQPLPYAIIALTLFSHVILDLPQVRIVLANFYDSNWSRAIEPPISQAFPAECWFYGLLMVLAFLWRGAAQRDAPRRARQATMVFAALALGSAVTRLWWLCAIFYSLAMAYALLLLRRELRPALAWSLIPVLPVVIYTGSELWRAHLNHVGEGFYLSRDYPAGIVALERAAKFPTREPREWTYIHLGQCYESIGEPAAAETAYHHAARVSSDQGRVWTQYWLAYLYLEPKYLNSSYHRPAEAARLLDAMMAASPNDPEVQRIAKWLRGKVNGWSIGPSAP